MKADKINKKELLLIRKNLRNNATMAEVALWNYLKGRRLLGRKFRRQTSIGNYVLDFYCPQEKLGIELDGKVHEFDSVSLKDRYKSEYLTSLGVKILRFENKEIFNNLEKVLKIIKDTIIGKPPLTPP